MTLSCQHRSIVYLFTFVWWQHCYDATLIKTYSRTRKQTVFDWLYYQLSQTSWKRFAWTPTSKLTCLSTLFRIKPGLPRSLEVSLWVVRGMGDRRHCSASSIMHLVRRARCGPRTVTPKMPCFLSQQPIICFDYIRRTSAVIDWLASTVSSYQLSWNFSPIEFSKRN